MIELYISTLARNNVTLYKKRHSPKTPTGDHKMVTSRCFGKAAHYR